MGRPLIFLLFIDLFILSLFPFQSTSSAESSFNKVKDDLSGKIKMRLKIDYPKESGGSKNRNEGAKNLYIYNRLEMRYGENYKWGGVFRKGGEEPPLTMHNFNKYYLKKFYFIGKDFLGFNKILLGDYQLQFHQGLALYSPLGVQMHRPVKINPKGITPDVSTQKNKYFRGIALQKRIGNITIDAFGSYKKLDCSLDDEGKVKESLITIREREDYISSQRDLDRFENLKSTVLGTRVGLVAKENIDLGFLWYTACYSPGINPPKDAGYYLFRGRNKHLYGFYLDTWYRNINSIFECGKSLHNGLAWLIQHIFHFKRYLFWTTLYDYDPDYYNEYSSGPTIVGRKDKDWNEAGFIVGMGYKGSTFKANTYFNGARHKFSTPPLPSNQNEFFIELAKDVTHTLKLSFRGWILEQDTSSMYTWYKSRLEIVFQVLQNLRWRQRWERRKDFYEGKRYIGDLFFIDILYKINSIIKISNRFVFFDTPQTNMTEVEFLWRKSLLPYYWKVKGRGVRFIFMPEISINPYMDLWLKYENTYKIEESEMGWQDKSSHTLRVEYELHW